MRRHTTKKHTRAVECENCGKTAGSLDQRFDQLRCGDCGRFAEGTDSYCAIHEVDLDRLPTGYDDCPKCRRERDIEAQRREQQARRADPRMHNTVDAPRF